MPETGFRIRSTKLAMSSLAYYFVSFLGFIFTSGGWNIFLEAMIAAAFFGLEGIVWLFNLLRPGARDIFVAKKVLLRLAVVQAFAMLVNIGDFGDSVGMFSFFELLLGRSRVDPNGFANPPMLGPLAGPLAAFGALSYMIALVAAQRRILRDST